MKRADYRRLEHNRKKQEREQQEKESKKQEEQQRFRKILRSEWKMVLGLILLILVVIVFVAYFTVKTENPLLLMFGWWMLYQRICSYSKKSKPKLFKWLIGIPVFEFLVSVAITDSCILKDDWSDYELGLLSLCTFFDSLINGVLYLGVRFADYKYEKREKKRKK